MHEKYAIATWEPSQRLLNDRGKPRKLRAVSSIHNLRTHRVVATGYNREFRAGETGKCETAEELTFKRSNMTERTDVK
jgi:hypothetical protein